MKTWIHTNHRRLYQHKSGVYYVRLSAGGKKTWRSLKTKTLKVALGKLREYLDTTMKPAFILYGSDQPLTHHHQQITLPDANHTSYYVRAEMVQLRDGQILIDAWDLAKPAAHERVLNAVWP